LSSFGEGATVPLAAAPRPAARSHPFAQGGEVPSSPNAAEKIREKLNAGTLP